MSPACLLLRATTASLEDEGESCIPALLLTTYVFTRWSDLVHRWTVFGSGFFFSSSSSSSTAITPSKLQEWFGQVVFIFSRLKHDTMAGQQKTGS